MGPDPALVFSQILGVIKGSEGAIGTQQRCLDQNIYLATGGQGLSSHTKEAIYDLFTAYTKIKQQYQEYDAADQSVPSKYSHNSQQLMFDYRTHHIIKELCDVGWKEEKGKKVDFLSV